MIYKFIILIFKYKIYLYYKKSLQKHEHMFYNIIEVVLMIPDQYKHETDYRNIPREYLDANIPQGRGMIKWAPFAVMPEQYERINAFIENQNKIAMPSLSDDQFNILNRRLIEKYTTHQLAMISYFRNGTIHSIVAYIKRIDTLNQYITISNENGSQTMKLDFAVLCHIE